MNDDVGQEQHTEPQGRLFHATVYGDTVSEIEFAALDAARKFFGEGPRLRIVPDYQVIGTTPNEKQATGKQYGAGTRVRVIEP